MFCVFLNYYFAILLQKLFCFLKIFCQKLMLTHKEIIGGNNCMWTSNLFKIKLVFYDVNLP